MGIFRAYFFKLIRSPLFYIGILGTAAVCASRRLFPNGMMGGYVALEINLILDLDSMRKVIAIFGALPFAANFADEWTNTVTTSCVSRCGVRKYAFSNIALCFISSLIAVFLGMMLYAVICSVFMPLYNYDQLQDHFSPLQRALILSRMPVLYIIYYVFVFAASCAMWSVMGMMLTAFFPNKYVAICSPFVASYIIERISMQLPDTFNLWYVSLSRLGWENVWVQFFYSVGLFVAIAAICGLVFAVIVKRRVQNEIT